MLTLGLAPDSGARQASAPLKTHVTFEEVSPRPSGITWVHNTAHSSERFLPETVGAGCAFLDYDNDGWMDIYLVNSGPSDFFKPTIPLKNADACRAPESGARPRVSMRNNERTA